jgi:esterase/lipase superfamily enzyme
MTSPKSSLVKATTTDLEGPAQKTTTVNISPSMILTTELDVTLKRKFARPYANPLLLKVYLTYPSSQKLVFEEVISQDIDRFSTTIRVPLPLESADIFPFVEVLLSEVEPADWICTVDMPDWRTYALTGQSMRVRQGSARWVAYIIQPSKWWSNLDILNGRQRQSDTELTIRERYEGKYNDGDKDYYGRSGEERDLGGSRHSTDRDGGRDSTDRDSIHDNTDSDVELEESADLGFINGANAPLSVVQSALGSAKYCVYYGTNRNIISTSEGVSYGDETSTQIDYGFCEVNIPEYHLYGHTTSTWFQKIIGHDGDLKIIHAERLDKRAFFARIQTQISQSEEATAVVFIHGFNVTFLDAAIRTAQLGVDLKIGGAMAFFSWPSSGNVLKYASDIRATEETEVQLESFLLDFASKAGAQRVNLIAHSAGNRPLLRCIDRICLQKNGTVKFENIVLAAADLTDKRFGQCVPQYVKLSRLTTLYVSSRDNALLLSELLHGRRRSGQLYENAMSVYPDVDTIVATDVDSSLLGHGYFASAGPVIQDLSTLLLTNAAPKHRARLIEKQFKGITYWRLQR